MDDWTIIVRNAIAVLVVLAGIALVLFLAFLGVNSANKGGQKLSESVSALDTRAMETYSQTTVSGTTALAAVKNYRGSSIGVIVITGEGTGNGTSINYCARFGTWNDTTNVFTEVAVTTNFIWAKNTTQDGVVINNNYLISADKQNNDIRNAITKNTDEYINPSARFKSCIIFNANGEAIGILLVQTTLTTRAGSMP